MSWAIREPDGTALSKVVIIRVDAAGKQIGVSHIAKDAREATLCGADERQPGNWQVDIATEPTCKKCLACWKELAPLFPEWR